MTADIRVIPVGDVNRAVGRDANIGGPEPFVRLRAGDDVHGARLETGAVTLHWISAHDTRPGVAMDDLVAKDVRQEFPFVNQNARR